METETKQTFQQKVKALSFSQLIREMVAAIRENSVELDIYTFGEVKNGICYGCVATNLCCRLAGKVYPANVIEDKCNRAKFLGVSTEYLSILESKLNALRSGWFEYYHRNIALNKLPPIPEKLCNTLCAKDMFNEYNITSNKEEVLQLWLKLADDSETIS